MAVIEDYQRISDELDALLAAGKLTYAKWEALRARAEAVKGGIPSLEFIDNYEPPTKDETYGFDGPTGKIEPLSRWSKRG